MEHVGIAERTIVIFKCIFVFIPLGMAGALAIVYMLGGWGKIIEGHDLGYYFLPSISISTSTVVILVVWIGLCMGLTYVAGLIGRKIDNNMTRKLFFATYIFFIALVIRLLFLYLYSEDLMPYSDFSMAWERAKGNWDTGMIDYYRLFPAYLFFSRYESLLIRLFGEKYMAVLYLNALYSALTAFFVYYICAEITLDKAACISGIFYALYPSCIIYTATGTPEFPAILFSTMGLFIVLKADSQRNNWIKMTLYFWGGVFLGIGGSFKTFSVIIVIAYAMISLIRLLLENKQCRIKIFVSACAIVILIAGYGLSSSLIMDRTSDYYNIELDSKTATPHYLLIGLNTESEGQIHIGNLSRLYNQKYLSNGMNYEEARDFAYDLLKNDWINNKHNIMRNLAKKMIWAWQDDCAPIQLFLETVGVHPDSAREQKVYSFIEEYGGILSETVYFIILVFAMIGATCYAKCKGLDLKYEILALIIFGYFCMIFLAEGQSRYKCLVMPFIIIISGTGMDHLIKWVHAAFEGQNKE